MDHFDVIARWYDRVFGRPGNLADLAALLALRPGARLLDAGGGTGRVTADLAGMGVRVVVCDRSRAMVEQARSKGLVAVQASVDRLPFRSHAVSAGLVVDAFHHFAQPSPQVMQPRAAEELLRVLAPGGRLLIQEPDIRRPVVKLIAFGEKMLSMGSRFLPPAQLAALFRQAGAAQPDVVEDGYNFHVVIVRLHDDQIVQQPHMV